MRTGAKVAVKLDRVVTLCVKCVEWTEVRLCYAHVVVVKIVNYLSW